MTKNDVVDPTVDERLQRLKNEVLAQLGARKWLTLARSGAQKRFRTLRNSPLSLVLSGGGGKGAYEAGVILALFDCGFRKFDAIAGTSVGGLNAALCHQLIRTGDRNLVLRIWSDIALEKVLRPSFMSLIKLGLYLPLSLFVGLSKREELSRRFAKMDDLDHYNWQKWLLRTLTIRLAFPCLWVRFSRLRYFWCWCRSSRSH